MKQKIEKYGLYINIIFTLMILLDLIRIIFFNYNPPRVIVGLVFFLAITGSVNQILEHIEKKSRKSKK